MPKENPFSGFPFFISVRTDGRSDFGRPSAGMRVCVREGCI
jgi:hypothetical protein